jgi:hypothetical protein
MRAVQDAARSLGLQLHVINASTESEIDTAFRRHKMAGRGTRRFSGEVVYQELGLLRLEC